MTPRRQIAARCLALLLLPALAATGVAQESKKQDAAPAAKNILSLFDSKIAGDPKSAAATAAFLESAYQGKSRLGRRQ